MTSKFSSLKSIVCLEVAKLFWDASFKTKNSELNKIIIDSEGMWEVHLTMCREEAISKLNNLIRNRKLPSHFKTIITENIFLLFQAYHQLFFWKEKYDSRNEFDLLQKGEYYAPKYFTVEGDFNDILWAKRYVCDPKCNVIDRFSLSCCYFFEKESENLWLEIKQKYIDIRENINFIGYVKKNLALISGRALQLENQINFWSQGFELASESGCEHAVYHFWERMSNDDKTSLLQTHKLFEIMSNGIDFPRDRICYFLFSQLTEENKEDLLDWTIENYRHDIWHTLLISPCSKSIRTEIIKFYDEFPTEMYADLLTALAERINTLKLPYDIETFQVLWNNPPLEKKYEILQSSTEILQILAISKSLNILKNVIKCLSREQKLNCLLHNEYDAGITIVDMLCDDGEFEMLQTYLSLFLTETDASSEKEVFSNNALLTLQNFTESSDFLQWRKSETFKKNEIEVLARLESLKLSLTS